MTISTNDERDRILQLHRALLLALSLWVAHKREIAQMVNNYLVQFVARILVRADNLYPRDARKNVRRQPPEWHERA
jgi:hypothetical protein